MVWNTMLLNSVTYVLARGLVSDLRDLIGNAPGLSCDGLGDEYLLEILDWAATDRIDKVAGL